MKPYIEAEVILGAWSRRVETSSGITDGYLKLYLSDDNCLDILSRLPETDLRGTKKSGGKLFKLFLFEYDGTEPDTLADMSFEPPPAPKKLSNIANIIVKQQEFFRFSIRFLKEYIKLMQERAIWDFDADQKDKLLNLIMFVTSIESMKELDASPEAANIFRELILKPYDLWKEENNAHIQS